MPHRSENWGKTLSGLRSRGHGVGGCVCGGGCPRRAPSPPATLARATGCGRSRPLPPAAVPGSAVPSPARRPSGRSGGGSAPRAAARDEPEEMTYLLCEPSASPRPCPAAAGPGRPPPPHHHVAEARRGGERGRHVEGKVLSRRRRDAARASRGRGGPRATAMPGQPAPAPGRAASPRSRFGAPRGVTPSSHQRHPARCPSRRARSQGRRAPPDPPEPGPYPRAGRRCLH